jgi:hypothetical protein
MATDPEAPGASPAPSSLPAAPSTSTVADIFGDESDEDVSNAVSAPPSAALSRPAAAAYDSDEGSLFGSGSDDDKKPAVRRDDLLDSDDDDVPVPRIQFDKRTKKGTLKRRGDKLKEKESSAGRIKKKAKRTEDANPAAKKAGSGKKAGASGDSGDEYDSGEEVVATAEDAAFMSDEDDLADIAKEYDEDEQDFDDHRPVGKAKSAAKSRTSKPSQSQSHSKGDQDPFSRYLAERKGPRAAKLSDSEKEVRATRLLKEMTQAKTKDDECFARGLPATHKLSLLPTVTAMVGVAELREALLENDLLCSLRDWIEPRDSETLPALALRTAIYKLLPDLVSEVDQLKYLKRPGAEGKQTIGAVIVALRKHKSETPDNKRLLKSVMDRWSRLVLSSSETVDSRYKDEIDRAISAHYTGNNPAIAAEGVGSRGLSGMLHSTSSAATTPRNASTSSVVPRSAGFLFTVQPTTTTSANSGIETLHLSEQRSNVYRKSLERRHNVKKLNPRAYTVSTSGGGLGM